MSTSMLAAIRGPRPGLGVRSLAALRFQVAQRERVRLITRALLLLQMIYAVVGITVHGPGSLAADATTSTMLGAIFLGFSLLLWFLVGRIRVPAQLEMVGLACGFVSMTVAVISEVGNPQAGHAVAVYQGVAVVLVAVVMPWRARAHYLLVGYTSVVAFAGIALTAAEAQEGISLAGAMVFAFVVAALAAGLTCRNRSERWASSRRVIRLNGALREGSLVDAMTGIGNRLALDAHLARIASQRVGIVGLAIVDVDHFKTVNDTFGHLAGDDVLRLIARMIQAAVRAGDRVYRYGGEEFLVVMGEIAPGTAGIAGERIRRAVSSPALPSEEYGGGIVTVSVGTAEVAAPAALPRLMEAIAEADRRLYAAKAGGRDCVVSDDEGDDARGADRRDVTLLAG
jgi:diguanylate cyclase (GGDEF)-like protein